MEMMISFNKQHNLINLLRQYLFDILNIQMRGFGSIVWKSLNQHETKLHLGYIWAKVQ